MLLLLGLNHHKTSAARSRRAVSAVALPPSQELHVPAQPLCSTAGCCQQHRCWHKLVAMAEAINVSKPKSPGNPYPGKILLLLGWEPIPCNAQQNTLRLTLQSTVLRICLSESLLRASAGFGWATMCWRLDLAIAFLEDTGGLAITSGEEKRAKHNLLLGWSRKASSGPSGWK